MRANKAILCGVVLAATCLAMAEPAPNKPGDNCLRQPYYSKVRSLDPATCWDGMSMTVQAHVFEGLYAYHYLKRPVEVIPLLADGMPKISQDGLVWTIKIRKGVKYSRNACFGLDDKGKPRTRTVKADDFVLAFKRIADSHVKSPLATALFNYHIAEFDEYRKKTKTYGPGDFFRYDNEKLDGVVALDAHTLQIKLKRIAPQFLHLLTTTHYAPFPREVIDYYLAWEADGSGSRRPVPRKDRKTEILDSEAMVGTGPYVLSRHIPGKLIIFRRNPNFRDQRYPSQGAPGDRAAGLLADAGKRLPFIDRVEFIWTPNPELNWKAFGDGMIDRSLIHNNVFAEVVRPDLKLTRGYADKGIRLKKSPTPGIFWIAINMKDPILGKGKSLRQALSLCIDKEDHVKTVFRGRGKPAVNCLPSSMSDHSAAGPGPYARFDLAAAGKKLIDARKELAAAGLLKDGRIPALTLDMGTTDANAKAMAKFMRKQFAAIGLKVDVKLNAWPTLLDKTNKGNFQMLYLGWIADYHDPENFLQLFYSPNIGPPKPNYTRYANRAYDDLYRKFTSLPYGPARAKLCKKLVSIISEDCPILPMYEPMMVVAHHKWLGNFKQHPIAIGLGTARYLRIDTKARAAAAPAGPDRKKLP